jgi:hypothetical protein
VGLRLARTVPCHRPPLTLAETTDTMALAYTANHVGCSAGRELLRCSSSWAAGEGLRIAPELAAGPGSRQETSRPESLDRARPLSVRRLS